MSNNEGTPLHGDRAAWNVVDHDTEHAKDIDDAALTRHLPAPSGAGTYARDNGTNWVAQLGLLLADLADYAQGAIIRGGAAAWEALTIGVADTVLKSNGTDAAWGTVGHDELSDIAADDHHDPVTLDANADTLLSLSTQALGLDTQAANTALAGPTTGAAAVPTFRALLEADISDLDHTDANAIHDNVAGEIHAIAEKATPVNADEIVIEDSADSWAKKRVAVSNLPFSGGGANLLFSQVVNVTVGDTTTETTILGSGRGSKTLDANALDQGSVIAIVGHGYLSTTGTPTLNLKVTLGGTLVCSTGAVTLADTISDQGFSFRAEIVCRASGAGGSVVASGTLEYSSGNQHKLLKTSTTAIDTTGVLDVDATITWGTAHASNTITCQISTIELIEADGLAVAAPSGLTAVEV